MLSHRSKFLKWGLLVVIFTALAFVAGAYAKTIYKEVEVYPPTKEDLKQLLSLGFDPTDALIYDEGRRVVLPLNDQEMELLRETGLDYRVLIEDMEAYYSSQFLATADMGPYTSFSEMVDSLTNLHNHHPNITTDLIVLGYGHDGNEVYAMKISDNPNLQEDEAEALYTGIHHAREPISMENLLYFMAYLCNNYGSDPDVTYLVDNRQLWFIPCMNPDGYLYNEQISPNGGGMWRKNRRDNGTCYGVDPNRNYGYMWGYDNRGSSPTPSSETYRGPYAFSEPENQAVRDFALEHDFTVAMNDHTHGYYFLFPWGYEDIFCGEHEMFRGIGEEAVSLLSPGNYDLGTAWQCLYNTNGDANDWFYGELGVFSYTPEIGESFWPGGSRILPLCEEMLPANIFFAEIADNPWQMMKVWAPTIDPLGTQPSGNYTVSWSLPGGDLSPDKYELQEMGGPSTITDNVESGSDNWVMKSFSRSSSRSYSGTYSFWSGYSNSYNATMTSLVPFKVESGMSLSFRLWYNIESGYDFGFVEVSTDGHGWEVLDSWTGGGTSWSLKTYSLSSYVGQYLFVRFRFDTDIGYTSSGMYIDDIYPVDLFLSVVTLSDNITENHYDVTGKTPGTYYYQVRGHNRTGWGNFSPREEVIVTGGGPAVTIELTPDQYYVPRGERLTYTARATNQTGERQDFDYWGMVTLPNGNPYGPVFGPNGYSLPPYQSGQGRVSKRVPGGAPLGTYTYTGCVGEYPGNVWDSDEFTFEVTAKSGVASGPDDWELVYSDGFWHSAGVTMPQEFGLFGNYPNPFNASTVIDYQLPVDSHVKLEVYNISGQKIATLLDGRERAGYRSVTWDASEVSSGVYFYKLTAGDFTEIKRMMLVK
jgi:hypothetical protein